jgi:hypothetical protein
MDLLAPLEHSAFSAWVRESGSMFAYPGILFLHTIGLGLLVGTNTAISLRILGVAKGVALAPMARFLPLMWAGFWINAASGSILLVADASTKLANPAFVYKMGCIALGVIAAVLTRRTVFRPAAPDAPVPAAARWLALASLLFWTGAITAGRLMAYVGQDSGAPEFLNRIGRIGRIGG